MRIMNGGLIFKNRAYGERNVIVEKSYVFALKIVTLYKRLTGKKEYVLSKQLLRSGTSIGANVQEAVASQSKRDFIHKFSIAVKEARETACGLNLLKDSHYISQEELDALYVACTELIKILNSIILATKERYLTKS